MRFLDLVNHRQSVREYLNQPVERDKIARCLEAARLAPSASNSQPWKFIVIDDPQLKEAVAKKTFGKLVSFNHFTLQAPVLIVIVTEKPKLSTKLAGIVKKRPFYLIDIGIAAIQFCLQAAEENLGTCILGWFNEPGIKRLLKIPATKRIDLILTLGYPKSAEIRPKIRKETGEMASYNQY